MEDKKNNLADVLFSKARRRLLGLLFSQPDVDFHTNKIIRLTRVGSGAIQRELASLSEAGLIQVKKTGNQKSYQANRNSPLFTELHSIVVKTLGVADVLRETLMPLAGHIAIAFVYGSMARGEDNARSDIDLMLIASDLTYADLYQRIGVAERQLSRQINPTIYSPSNWKKKLAQENHFIKKVLAHRKIFILGEENDLNRIG